MSTKIYFDLDGTLFDLYNKKNWFEDLTNERNGVFEGDFLEEIDTDNFYEIIDILLSMGVTFGVITWLPMQASPEYEEVCREEKMRWVRKNLPFVSEFNCVSYGTPKQNCIQKRAKRMFLIDDNVEICQAWETATQRIAINVNSKYTAEKALEYIVDKLTRGD